MPIPKNCCDILKSLRSKINTLFGIFLNRRGQYLYQVSGRSSGIGNCPPHIKQSNKYDS